MGVFRLELGEPSSFGVDGVEEDWEEELSRFLSLIVGVLVLIIFGGSLSVPGSMKRGAGVLFLPDFLRNSSMVEVEGLLELV